MALTIVVSCCSVPQLYKYKQKQSKKYVRRVVSLYTRVILQKLSYIIGLPVIFANEYIYCLLDAKSALVACSQLLVVTNNLNPAGCLA